MVALTLLLQTEGVPGVAEIRCWGWFVQLDHPSVLHRPLDGQRELLKGAEEYQVVRKVIRAVSVGWILGQSSILRTQSAFEE
jgi:hypothetical protein